VSPLFFLKNATMKSEEGDEYKDIWNYLDDLKKGKTQENESKPQDEWLSKRIENGYGPVDESHSCDYVECFIGQQIVTISREQKLFGCLKSGKIHLCDEDTNCHTTYVNSDGTRTCFVSGLSKTPLMEKLRYGKSDSGCEDEGESDKEKDSGGEDEEENNSNNINEDIDYDIYDEGDHLLFSSTIDAPINQQITASTTANTTPSPMNKRKRKRNKAVRIKGESMNSEYHCVIYDLLYNSKAREIINKEKSDYMREKAKTEVKKYYKRCNKTKKVPVMSVVDDTFDHFNNQKELLYRLPYDKDRISYYFELSRISWSRITNTNYYVTNKSRFHFRQHVIGMLYLMKSNGYYCSIDENKKVLLFPKDVYLANGLPSPSDMVDMPSTSNSNKRYCKKDITNGRNNIKTCISTMEPDEKLKLSIELTSVVSRFIHKQNGNGSGSGDR
jgi:hypothetical protein